MITITCDTQDELEKMEQLISSYYCPPEAYGQCQHKTSCAECTAEYIECGYRSEVKLTSAEVN